MLISDWSSDVCSSDLAAVVGEHGGDMRPIEADTEALGHTGDLRWVPQESEAHLVDETAGALRPRGRLGVTAHRLYAHGTSSGEQHRGEPIGHTTGQRAKTDAPATASLPVARPSPPPPTCQPPPSPPPP